MTGLIEFFGEFTTFLSWVSSTFYNVIVNLPTYVNQLMVVIDHLPDFVKFSCVAGISLTFVFFLIDIF